MSHATPVRTSLRTQRASETKRALFQQPIVTPLTLDHNEDSSEESCDLGIMSTIDTDSSDIDQFVPMTPSSWRPAARSYRSSDRKNIAKEILKSPLTFRNYSSRHGSRSSLTSTITDLLADTESCSSSLKDLRFHSDSDMSDEMGQTPEKRTSKRRYPLRNYQTKSKENVCNNSQKEFKKALKSLDFERVTEFNLPDEIKNCASNKSNKSPTKMLKTPHENGTTAQTPPRIHHKFMKDTEKSAESDSQKRPSSNVPAPKARLSLFGSCEIKLSPKSFYPKSNTSSSISDVSKLLNTTWPSHKQAKSHKNSRFVHKKNKKKNFGEINKGVWHSIHKPKPKAVTKEKALNIALKIIENSKLNDYIDQFMLTKQKKLETDRQNDNPTEKQGDLEIAKDMQQVNQTLKQFGCDVSVESLVNTVSKVNELASTFQVNKPIDLTKSLAPPKPAFDLNRSLISNRSYDLNQSFDSMNRSTDLNMSFTESEITYDDNESVMSDFDTASTSKKIFKVRSSESRKAVMKMRNLKLEIANGKMHLPKKRQQPDDGVHQIWKALENKIAPISSLQLDASDLLTADEDDDAFKIPEMDAIESLLSQWNEENVPETEPLITCGGRPAADLTIDNINISSQNNINSYNSVDSESQTDLTSVRSNLDVDNTVKKSPKYENNLQFKQRLVISANQSIDCSNVSLSNCDFHDRWADLNVHMEEAPNDKKRKLYPIFDKDMVKIKQAKFNDESCVPTLASEVNSLKFITKDKNQYIIDAGQKKLGVIECGECGVIYHIGDPEDERDHMIHHTGLNVLRFNGWKTERECGSWPPGRVLVVQPGDPHTHWRKVSDLLERIVHPQLGYAAPLAYHQTYKVYIYVENKQIIGCLVAESANAGFKMLPGENCISMEEHPVKSGISRLWVHKNHRRRNIATRLVDCFRANFYHGYILARQEIAFSTPTTLGRAFAQKYFGREDFYVYLEAHAM